MRKNCKCKEGICGQQDELTGCEKGKCICHGGIGQIEVTKPACKVLEGDFCVDIEELRRQVRAGRAEVGSNGIQTRQGTGVGVKIPKGTFHRAA